MGLLNCIALLVRRFLGSSLPLSEEITLQYHIY